MDLISIVIPTFNRSTLVVKAVESALQQTYREREIIVIDDGSTDDTRERLRPFQDRIRYFHQPNQGASAAQNKGIALATGTWVSVLASDDLWLPHKLETQVSALAKLGPEFGACFTDCTFSGDPTCQQGAFAMAGLRCSEGFAPLVNPVDYVLGRHPALWVQSMMVRRSLLLAANGFDEKLPVAEDTDLIFRLASQTRFCVVAESLVVIDRDPAHSRLTEFFARLPERWFLHREYLCRKWLKLPEAQSPALRGAIEEHLRGIHYDQAIHQLKRLRIISLFKTLRRISTLGHSPPHVATQILVRVSRALLAPAR